MKEFEGNLKKTKPEYIIPNDEHTREQEFFLILGIIYNDIKDIIFFLVNLEDEYRKPEKDEISVQAGCFGGIGRHIDRLASATIHEFFKFLDSYRDVISTYKFNLMMKSFNSDRKKEWNTLVAIALNQKTEETKLAQALLEIRNNSALCY